MGVSNLSFIFAPTFRGQALSLAYLAPIGMQWRIDTNLRYYRQSDDSGGSQTRLSPGIKVSWHWHDRVYLEGEIGEEIWRSDTRDRQDCTSRAYLYTGLRWDFR